MRRNASEVSSPLLLTLDRLEEGLEVALSEAAGAVALDDLEEHGRPVARGLGEDLQQVALVVAVDQDPEPAQVLDVLLDLADPLRDLLVVLSGIVRNSTPRPRSSLTQRTMSRVATAMCWAPAPL